MANIAAATQENTWSLPTWEGLTGAFESVTDILETTEKENSISQTLEQKATEQPLTFQKQPNIVASTEQAKDIKTSFNDESRMDAIKESLDLNIMEKLNAGAKFVMGDSFNAYSGILASREPSQILNSISKGFPEMKGTLDKIAADPKLASAFKDALVKDPTMLEGLQRLAGKEGGMNGLKMLEEGLDSPAVRKTLTIGLENLANQDEIKFAQLERFANSVSEFDTGNLNESRLKIKESMMGLGIEESTANGLIVKGGAEIVSGRFQKDPMGSLSAIGDYATDNLSGMGGFLGSTLAAIGPMLSKLFEAIGPMLQDMMQGMKGMFSQMTNSLGDSPMSKITSGISDMKLGS